MFAFIVQKSHWNTVAVCLGTNEALHVINSMRANKMIICLKSDFYHR